MIKRMDFITTVVIFVITVIYTLEALQFPGGAKIVPTIFGAVALVIVVIQLLSSRVNTFKKLSAELEIDDTRDLDVFRDPAARRRLLIISASLLAVPVIIVVFGLAIALPIYVAGMLLVMRQRLSVVIACTALIALTSYGLLVRLLAWPWNDGVLWWLLG